MKLFIIISVILFSISSYPQELISGVWKTEDGKALIKIEVVGDSLTGTAVGGENRDGRDDKNPDPSLRNRPLLGINILSGFRSENREMTKWTGGTVYDPNNGKTYSSTIEADGDSLKIRGFVGLPLFGRTVVWKRVLATP